MQRYRYMSDCNSQLAVLFSVQDWMHESVFQLMYLYTSSDWYSGQSKCFCIWIFSYKEWVWHFIRWIFSIRDVYSHSLYFQTYTFSCFSHKNFDLLLLIHQWPVFRFIFLYNKFCWHHLLCCNEKLGAPGHDIHSVWNMALQLRRSRCGGALKSECRDLNHGKGTTKAKEKSWWKQRTVPCIIPPMTQPLV